MPLPHKLPELNRYLTYFKKNKASLFEFYFDLLKIKSISTDPNCQGACHEAAKAAEEFLKCLGFNTEIHEANNNYLLFAERHVSPSAKTLMFYGHTDVQPADPESLWDHPPFEPTLKQGAVYARGAQDNKGQLCYVLSAIKAYLELEENPHCNIKLLIEGEEESGSHGTELLLKQLGTRLKSDELYIVDFDAKSASVPSIVLGMRGLAAFEIKVFNANTDLHSGMYGGVVYNPLRALCEMLASCFNDEGLLAFKGAYAGLEPLEMLDLQAIDFSFNQEHLKHAFGVEALCVPKGKKAKEANWLLPTFEINGFFGGYMGDGVKTVLPREASAKISCRLGKGQDPLGFIEACKAHLFHVLPKGMKLEFKVHQAAPSFYTSLNCSSVTKAKNALEASFNHTAWIGLSGASVPIVGALSAYVTSNVALMGVGLDTDNIHAPNEHFSLDRFEKGFYAIAHILQASSQ